MPGRWVRRRQSSPAPPANAHKRCTWRTRSRTTSTRTRSRGRAVVVGTSSTSAGSLDSRHGMPGPFSCPPLHHSPSRTTCRQRPGDPSGDARQGGPCPQPCGQLPAPSSLCLISTRGRRFEIAGHRPIDQEVHRHVPLLGLVDELAVQALGQPHDRLSPPTQRCASAYDVQFQMRCPPLAGHGLILCTHAGRQIQRPTL